MPFAPTTLTMNEAETVLAQGLQQVQQMGLGLCKHQEQEFLLFYTC
jgi:hypothetical protein